MMHPTTRSTRQLFTRCSALAVAVAALTVACSDGAATPMTPSTAAAANRGAEAAASHESEGQRFRGTITAVSHATFVPATFSNVVHLVGTAMATPYGKLALVADFTVNLATEKSVGTLTLTARNGDVITASFTGLSSPAAPGVIAIVENATITGGTGRFAGATGSLVINRTLVRATGAVSGSFTGTIVRRSDEGGDDDES